ncbi:hypothetical protein ABZU25_31110 [Micromonospora sp. NPDC005215]|uniref:hypothetical protein n=1 Tax=Micromonospora sp. NPDC005215 TaxID=3157024 RepID=UPI0033A81693
MGTWTQQDGTTLLVTAGNDRVVRLWHPDSLQPATELHGHDGAVHAIATRSRPDGTTLLVTAGKGSAVRFVGPTHSASRRQT